MNQLEGGPFHRPGTVLNVRKLLTTTLVSPADSYIQADPRTVSLAYHASRTMSSIGNWTYNQPQSSSRAGNIHAYENARIQVGNNYYQPEDRCLADLRSTDPHDDKTRIEQTKGGLLRDSYCWVLDNAEFLRWRDDRDVRLLWIKGDPGKGKTMLLCGIIDELSVNKLAGVGALLSYFFCQAADPRINTATGVLRGLIYLLIKQEPALVSHVRIKYKEAGKALFEDSNAWVALSEIFTNMLEDPKLSDIYLVIDALDECTTDLSPLLDLIRKSTYLNVKWIVSSRNWPSIQKFLDKMQKGKLNLELNENSISDAVAKYIRFKVGWLTEQNEYDNETQDVVCTYLLSNANNTFLWVALVCQELADISGWEVERMLTAFPPGLNTIYQRMMDQICASRNSKLCKDILAVISIVRRPITLDELPSLVDMPRNSNNYEALTEIVGLCGSFLTLQRRTISFVHQSAKDFLIQTSEEIFPSGVQDVHHSIFLRSLRVLTSTLRRDIYALGAPGFPLDQVKQPDPDPLAASRYSCVYWIDHLYDCDPICNRTGDLQDGGSVDRFLCRSYLYWLEALSLLKSISEGTLSMAKLDSLLQVRNRTIAT